MKFQKFFFLMIFITGTLISNGVKAQQEPDNSIELNNTAKEALIHEAHQMEASFPDFCEARISSFLFQNPSQECRAFISECEETLKEKTREKIYEGIDSCQPKFNEGDTGCFGMGLGADFQLSQGCYDGRTGYTDCLDDIDLPRIFAKEKAKWQILMRNVCAPQEDPEAPVDLPEEPEAPEENPPVDVPPLPEPGAQGNADNNGAESDDFFETIVVEGADGNAGTGGCSLQAVGGGMGNLWILALGALPLIIRKFKYRK